jgi:hypothetical protein
MNMSFINIEAMANAEYTRSRVGKLEGYFVEHNEPGVPKAKNTKQHLLNHYQRQKN